MSLKIDTHHAKIPHTVHRTKKKLSCLKKIEKIICAIFYRIFPCLKDNITKKDRKMSYAIHDTFGGFDTDYDYKKWERCHCKDDEPATENRPWDRILDGSLVSKKDIKKGDITSYEWTKKGGLSGLWYRDDYQKHVFSQLPKGYFFVKIDQTYDKTKKVFIDTFQILTKGQMLDLREFNILDNHVKVIKVQHHLFACPEGEQITQEEKRANRNPVLIKA